MPINHYSEGGILSCTKYLNTSTLECTAKQRTVEGFKRGLCIALNLDLRKFDPPDTERYKAELEAQLTNSTFAKVLTKKPTTKISTLSTSKEWFECADSVMYQILTIEGAMVILEEAIQYRFDSEDGTRAQKLVTAALDILRTAVPEAEKLANELPKLKAGCGNG